MCAQGAVLVLDKFECGRNDGANVGAVRDEVNQEIATAGINKGEKV